MRRREFIKVLAGSAAAWPLAVRAQQREQMRRVTVLLGGLEFYDASGQAEVAAFEGRAERTGLDFLGRNVDLDYHWPGAQTARVRAVANEIVAAHPDLVVSRSTPATAALIHAGLPIVLRAGCRSDRLRICAEFGHPGGNLTGFSPLNLPLAANGSRC